MLFTRLQGAFYGGKSYMDILKQVSDLKEFLGKVYCFIEDNEDSFKDGVEAEDVKNETWKWMQELAKFLPEE